jgi:hypothetical protein
VFTAAPTKTVETTLFDRLARARLSPSVKRGLKLPVSPGLKFPNRRPVCIALGFVEHGRLGFTRVRRRLVGQGTAQFLSNALFSSTCHCKMWPSCSALRKAGAPTQFGLGTRGGEDRTLDTPLKRHVRYRSIASRIWLEDPPA